MDFSECVACSGRPCFSPGGDHIALIRDNSLVVLEAETMQAHHIYPCADKVNQVEWSGDSKYILCAMHARGIVQVWSVENSQWRCRIDEGAAGVCYARWTPDARQVLTVADFQVRVAVRSLVNKTVNFLPGCKFGSGKGLGFSADGRLLAMLIRQECKDMIGIFKTEGEWDQVSGFQLETEDAAGMAWCPDDTCLAVWDGPLNYKLLLYSPEGSILSQFAALENQLGIKTVSWGPTGQFLALGSFDSAVRLLNNISWKTTAEYEHSNPVSAARAVLYCEMGGAEACEYVIHELPYTLPTEGANDPSASKTAVSQCSWSGDSKYLLTRSDQYPRVLWIWETLRLGLAAVVVQRDNIAQVKWAPNGDAKLALCTGGNKLFLWSPRGCSCVDIPNPGAEVNAVAWSACGRYLMAHGSRSMCVCYMATVDF
eukprot:TRINITY_DN26701_c0_g1_i2.p1 TRINITY_DN26701_c0_g1~~TRINITY_DN26701_c0_g1_i2.p1  ORF type:complete len:427 (-),score=83.10 TRINITY_DN26701_c0_g1_i2:209-1489(-)